MALQTVSMLWIGDALGSIEQTAVQSFLDHGHPVELFTYTNDLGNVPEGTTVRDANIVIPEKSVYRYKNGSVSAFSNEFRFTMLRDRGGVWVDTDVVCLRPMPWLANLNIAFASEITIDGKTVPTSHFIKLPKGSKVAAEAVTIQQGHRQAILDGTMEWGSGPKTMAAIDAKFGLKQNMLRWWTTSTCPPHEWRSLIGERSGPYPTRLEDVKGNTFVAHLWHELWRRDGKTKAEFLSQLKVGIFAQVRDKHLR